MNSFEKKQWIRIVLCLLAVVAAVLLLTNLLTGKELSYRQKSPVEKIMTATMDANAENSEAEDYLEQDPYLVNIYEGFGFSKDYMGARGHAYTLEDVTKTARPHAKANCITCKTPEFTKLVNEEGVGVYSQPFDDVMSQMTEPISCYTCHGADDGNGGKIVITHSYVEEALGENASQIDPKVLNCGQCHIEYYFTTEDSETMMPYHDTEGMTPEAILAYYDEIGFKDWEQPGTGTAMLKAQHPEMETFLGSAHAKMGLSCSDCHMALEPAEDGNSYHSHNLVSPLKSETLMATCAQCHAPEVDNAKDKVLKVQAKVTARETEVGNRLSGLKDSLTAAVTEGKMTEEELDAVRKLHREAQWFFDFCYVENSEGAHNSSLSMRCLDTADEKITEALILLGELEAPAEEETAPTGEKTASAQGFGGEVTVHVTLAEDGTIQALTIETPNETPGFGQRASEEPEFAAQFIGKAGPFTYGENGIDALSGATRTSGAVLEALNQLFTGGEPAAETKNDAVTGATQAEEKTEDAVSAATQAEEKTEDAVTGATQPEGQTEASPEEKPAESKETGAAQALYGSYLAERETNFSMIRVIASTQNGKIVKCRITSEAKSEGSDFLTDEIKTAWAKAIVENQTADTDVISGATLTLSSGAVREAVAEILEKMGGAKPAEETTTEEAKPEEETKQEETPAANEGDGNAQALYGSYLVEKETNFSVIRVIVSTQNGKIVKCRITSEAKSEGSDFLTDEIKTAWAKAIVENQTADTDVISGATLTLSSGAVREAVAEILEMIR